MDNNQASENQENKRQSNLLFGKSFLIFSAILIAFTFIVGVVSGKFAEYNDGIPNDIKTAADTTNIEK